MHRGGNIKYSATSAPAKNQFITRSASSRKQHLCPLLKLILMSELIFKPGRIQPKVSTGCLCLEVDSLLLGHTLAPRNLLCSVDVAPKMHFAPIWSSRTLTFDLWTSHFLKCFTLPQ